MPIIDRSEIAAMFTNIPSVIGWPRVYFPEGGLHSKMIVYIDLAFNPQELPNHPHYLLFIAAHEALRKRMPGARIELAFLGAAHNTSFYL